MLLDQLMNLAGQLVISKARFTLIGDGLKTVVRNRQATQSLNKVFSTLALPPLR